MLGGTSKPRQVAIALYARATRSRPREWPNAPRDLESLAAEDPTARDPLLYYAVAIARDRGDHATADDLLGRAVEEGSREPAWRREFELQATLADALVHDDPAAARARLDRLPPHPLEPGYPLLAHSATLAAENQLPQAVDALRRWREAVSGSSLGASRLEVGNLWALELLAKKLGPEAVQLARPSGPAVQKRGPVERLTLAVLGVVIAIGFGALAVMATIGAPSITCGECAAARGGRVAIIGLLGGLALVGVWLLVRALKGTYAVDSRTEQLVRQASEPTSSPRLLRWVPVAVFAVGWFSAGSLRSFFFLRGPETAQHAFTFLALWVAWHFLIALHEAAHALAAIVLRGRVHEVAVGSWAVRLRGGRWRLHRVAFRLFATGHVRVAFPRGRWPRLRYGLTVAAAPAAVLAFTFAVWTALSTPGASHVAIQRVLWATMLTGAVSFLASALPLRSFPGNNDAKLLAAIARGGLWYGNTGTQLAVHLWARERARDWKVSSEEIERATRESKESTGWGLLLSASRALDDGDAGTGKRLLVELTSTPGLDPTVFLEARIQLGLCAALLDGDPSRARSLLADAGCPPGDSYGQLCEAAALLAEGRNDEARAAYRRWTAFVDATGDADHVRLGNHWAIDAIVTRLG